MHVSVQVTDVVKVTIDCGEGQLQEVILDEKQSKRLGRMLIDLTPGGFDIA